MYNIVKKKLMIEVDTEYRVVRGMDELVAMISTVESRCRVRCVNPARAIAEAMRIFRESKFPIKAMVGAMYRYDSASGESFPACYGGIPESSWLTMEYRGGHKLVVHECHRSGVGKSRLIPTKAAREWEQRQLDAREYLDVDGKVKLWGKREKP